MSGPGADLKEGIRSIPNEPIPPPDVDSAASKEQQAILSFSYEDDAKRRHHKRDQGIKDIAYYATCGLVTVGVAIIGVSSLIWAWHLLMPPPWRWLQPADIEKLQGLLFSGALSAALTLLGRKIL